MIEEFLVFFLGRVVFFVLFLALVMFGGFLLMAAGLEWLSRRRW